MGEKGDHELTEEGRNLSDESLQALSKKGKKRPHREEKRDTTKRCISSSILLYPGGKGLIVPPQERKRNK